MPVGAGVGLAFLPHVAWENAAWACLQLFILGWLFRLARWRCGRSGLKPALVPGGLTAGVAALFADGGGCSRLVAVAWASRRCAPLNGASATRRLCATLGAWRYWSLLGAVGWNVSGGRAPGTR